MGEHVYKVNGSKQNTPSSVPEVITNNENVVNVNVPLNLDDFEGLMRKFYPFYH